MIHCCFLLQAEPARTTTKGTSFCFSLAWLSVLRAGFFCLFLSLFRDRFRIFGHTLSVISASQCEAGSWRRNHKRERTPPMPMSWLRTSAEAKGCTDHSRSLVKTSEMLMPQ